MSANIFTAGPARALFFSGDQLIGIGKTLSDTTFNTSITAEEVRGSHHKTQWNSFSPFPISCSEESGRTTTPSTSVSTLRWK